MLRLTFKNLMAHRVRLVATAVAVTIGVAFMAGTFVLTDTVTRTLNSLFATVYKGTDAVVRSKAAFNGPYNTGEQRARVDASLVPLLSRTKGVAASEGTIFGYARLVNKSGQAMGGEAMGAATLGTAWGTVPALNPLTLVAGRRPATDDEVVIDRRSARDGHLAVGDTTQVLVQGPPLTVHIVGISRFGSADSPGGASVVSFTTAAAQKYVAGPGKFDSIAFAAQKGVPQSQLVHNLSAVIPPGTEAVTGTQVTKEAQDQMAKAMAFFRTFMLVFAIVALLVGGFMIFNAFSITVAQRTRENGLLRALGARKRQLLGSVLLEAVGVGLLASVMGLPLGVLVAAGLKALMAGLGIEIPAGGIVLAARTVVIALVTGVGVTAFASLSPAHKAGKVPPIAAMQEAPTSSSGYGSKERVFLGVGLLVAGAGAFFAGLFAGLTSPMRVVGAGAMLVFFGVAVLGRTVSLPLSRALGSPLPRLRGVAGSLARQNAMRNPKRTAATTSALMICVGLVGFITIFASSARASISSMINRSFMGDFIISSGGSGFGGIDPSLSARVGRLPQVAASAGLRVGLAQVDGKVAMLEAIDPSTGPKVMDIQTLQGRISDLGVDAIAIYKNVATDKHLKVGDRIPVVFKDTGARALRVAVIYGSNKPAGDYFVGLPAYEANFANQYDAFVFVKKAPGVSAAAALAAVTRAAKAYPGTKVLDGTGFKAESAKPLNQLLGLVYVLLSLAVIIALLGIGNTLALSIFERTRELGLLRAVGMTRRQLRSAVRWESVVIALQGAVLGMAIGVFFGWGLVVAMQDKGTTVFSLPYRSLVEVLVLAAIAGVVAAALPARRAAKLNVLKAVVTD